MANPRRSRWLRRCLALVVPAVLCAGAILTLEGIEEAAPPRLPVVSPVPVSKASANAAAAVTTLTPVARPREPPRQVSTTRKVTRKADSRAPRRPSRVVYLTFDDGPSRYTGKILAILRRTGSTATFFQLGVNRPGRAALVKAILGQGSNIGNHTYDHPTLTRLSSRELRRQLANGPRSRCFRPPYGATNRAVRKAAKAAGMRQVLWTVDPQDWRRPGAATLARVGSSRAVRKHSIILLHDGGGDRSQTVKALPKLIANLHARGFKVRALPSCS